MEKEALLWKKLVNEKAECTACARRCKISEGSKGFCFVRQNKKGRLYLENYGILEAIQIDPIEKKPFNHFYPGSSVLGIGTSSCNFGCLFCQNKNISKMHEIKGHYFSPEDIVELAEKNNVDGIAYTYNEPAIFAEYAFDVAELAKRRGLFNVFVTNGFLTDETIDMMKGKIDAAVVGLKGNGEQKFSNKFEMVVSNDPIKEALKKMKKNGIHIEITDLIIPKVGESLDACDKLTKWISKELGDETPIQFTRFYPDYKMNEYKPTSMESLKLHYDTAKKNGLKYVYIGNVPGNEFENTYCAKCGSIAVERFGHYIKKWNINENNRCAECGESILVKGRFNKRQEHIKVLK